MKAYIVEQALVAENIKKLLAHGEKTKIWAVLKGNGYGLGVAPMAKLCHENGIQQFAVTEPWEAAAIREAGLTEQKILMLRATTDREELAALMERQVILTVSSQEDAQRICEIAAEKEISVKVHLKLDTGMGRYGFLPSEKDAVKEAIVTLQKWAEVTGVYTHFHSSFLDNGSAKAQFTAFVNACDALEAEGFSLGERHCCNSSAFLKYKEMHLDGVRLGSAILGRVAVSNTLGLQKVGYVETAVEELRTLPKGHTVGYGAATTVKRQTASAVIPVGYCHGFTIKRDRDVFRVKDCIREILAQLKLLMKPTVPTVTIHGRQCKTLGHVGMLHTCVDVTDLSVQLGDMVRMEINPLMVKNIPVLYR